MSSEDRRTTEPASPPRGDAGFTLVEVVVAIVIIGGALLAIVTASASGIGYQLSARHRLSATAVASQVMEEIRALPFERIEGGHSSADLDGMTVFAGCRPDDEGAGELLVTSPALDPVPALVPNEGTQTLDGITYDWSAWITRRSDAADAAYRVSVCVRWEESGRPQVVALQSFIWATGGAGPGGGGEVSSPWTIGEGLVPVGTITVTITDETAGTGGSRPTDRYSMPLVGARASLSLSADVVAESSLSLPLPGFTCTTQGSTRDCLLNTARIDISADGDATTSIPSTASGACGPTCAGFTATGTSTIGTLTLDLASTPTQEVTADAAAAGGGVVCQVRAPLTGTAVSPCATALGGSGTVGSTSALTLSLGGLPGLTSLPLLRADSLRVGTVVRPVGPSIEAASVRDYGLVRLLALTRDAAGNDLYFFTLDFEDRTSVSGGIPSAQRLVSTATARRTSSCTPTVSSPSPWDLALSDVSICFQRAVADVEWRYNVVASAIPPQTATGAGLAQSAGPSLVFTLTMGLCTPGDGCSDSVDFPPYRTVVITVDLGALTSSTRSSG